MQALPNGNHFIGWGSEPWLTEFAPDGRVLFDANITSAKHSYRAYRFPWTGQPMTPPDVAIERATSGQLTAFASWNGATEVAAWQALAGPDADSLEPAGDPTRRSGFETELSISTDSAFIAVAALDTAGAELARSVAIQM